MQQLTLPFLPRAVLLFCRAPQVEAQVKSWGAQSEDIHRTIVQSTLVAIRGIDADVDLILPGDQERGLRQVVEPVIGRSRRIRVVPVFGDGFGARLICAIAGVQALGYAPVVAIPGDVAELRPRHLHRAFALLGDGVPVVLGPARDGGLYLLGLCVPPMKLLRKVPWRSRTVRATVESNIRELGYERVILDPLADVDHPKGLRELHRRLMRRQPDHELVHLLSQAAEARTGEAPAS